MIDRPPTKLQAWLQTIREGAKPFIPVQECGVLAGQTEPNQPNRTKFRGKKQNDNQPNETKNGGIFKQNGVLFGVLFGWSGAWGAGGTLAGNKSAKLGIDRNVV